MGSLCNEEGKAEGPSGDDVEWEEERGIRAIYQVGD